MQHEPLFIVGAPRSGTTLLAAMLDAHSRMSCGPETHFFRKLAQVDAETLVAAENWPHTAVAFLAAIEHTTSLGSEKKFLLDKYQLQKEEITHFLTAKPPQMRHILAAITALHMQRSGKQRWIEKTPDHLAHVATIRHYFPNSPIVRIVRDPRDVALSLTKVPWGVQTVTEALLFLRRLDERSAHFFAKDGNTHTLRYEDLVTNPAGILTSLCDFLGESFEEGMLDTSHTGKRINSRNAPWKEKVSKPVDRSRVAVWRQALTAVENQLAEAILGDQIAAYGYPIIATFTHKAAIVPDEALLIKYSDSLAPVVADGTRFWAVTKQEPFQALLFLGDPGEGAWLGAGRWQRFRHAVGWVMAVLRATLAGKKVYWVAEPAAKGWSGISAGVLKFTLTLWGQPITTRSKEG